MGKLKAFLHYFDIYGEPIAPLNINGHTKVTTSLGGISGLAIAGLMIWFLQTRLDKLFGRKDAIMTEVTQGLDLMSLTSPAFDFQSNSYRIGIGIYGTKKGLTCTGSGEE